MFRNNNPDKGTETEQNTDISSCNLYRLEIITPIRGRKLLLSTVGRSVFTGLEIITPIRGRKQCFFTRFAELLDAFRNNNPDKGTET